MSKYTTLRSPKASARSPTPKVITSPVGGSRRNMFFPFCTERTENEDKNPKRKFSIKWIKGVDKNKEQIDSSSDSVLQLSAVSPKGIVKMSPTRCDKK